MKIIRTISPLVAGSIIGIGLSQSLVPSLLGFIVQLIVVLPALGGGVLYLYLRHRKKAP